MQVPKALQCVCLEGWPCVLWGQLVPWGQQLGALEAVWELS